MHTESSKLLQSNLSSSRLHQSNILSSRLLQSGFGSFIGKPVTKIPPKDLKDAQIVLSELRKENKSLKTKKTLIVPHISEIQPDQLLRRVGVLTANSQPRKTKRQSLNVNRSDMEKVFKLVDPNAEGYQLSYDKYLEKFKQFRFCLTQEEFNILSEESDYIDMDTLLELVEDVSESQTELIAELFRDLTDETNDCLEIKMIENSMEKFDLNCFNRTQKNLIQEFMDYDKDGKISLDDFQRFWQEMQAQKF